MPDRTGEGIVADAVTMNIIAGVLSLRPVQRTASILEDKMFSRLWEYRNEYVHDYAGTLVSKNSVFLFEDVNFALLALKQFMYRHLTQGFN